MTTFRMWYRVSTDTFQTEFTVFFISNLQLFCIFYWAMIGYELCISLTERRYCVRIKLPRTSVQVRNMNKSVIVSYVFENESCEMSCNLPSFCACTTNNCSYVRLRRWEHAIVAQYVFNFLDNKNVYDLYNIGIDL